MKCEILSPGKVWPQNPPFDNSQESKGALTPFQDPWPKPLTPEWQVHSETMSPLMRAAQIHKLV